MAAGPRSPSYVLQTDCALLFPADLSAREPGLLQKQCIASAQTQSYRLFSERVSVWVYGGLLFVVRIASRIQSSLPGFMLSFWWRLLARSRLPETSFSTWFPSTPSWDFLSPLVLLRHQNYSPLPVPQVPLVYFDLLMNQRDLLWNVR